MKRDLRLIFLLFSIVLTVHQSYAQNPDDGGGGAENVKGASQAGIFISRMLPNGVSNEDEIMQLWGLRYSYAMGSSFLDIGGIQGSGGGVDWLGLSGGVSMHVPIETLIGHAGVGVDYTRFKTSTESTQNEIGLHFIGGVMSHIGGSLLARFDMKLASKPGTYLLFGVGLVYELDGAAAGGGGD